MLVYIKTMDSVEGALWLATQTLNIPSYSPLSTFPGFAPKNIIIAAGTNELKSSFFTILSLYLVCTKTTAGH